MVNKCDNCNNVGYIVYKTGVICPHTGIEENSIEPCDCNYLFNITLREYITNELGVKVVDFCLLIGIGYRTLYNWYNNPKKRVLIDLIIDGIKWRNRHEE